jgi:hypothetical protein
MSVIEELVTRPTAARRARPLGARRWAALAGALVLVLPVGTFAWRALAPGAPATQPQPDASQQRHAQILATLEQARADGRAELRRARTPKGQARAARRLARAHGDAAASSRSVELSAGLVLTRAAYTELAGAFGAHSAERVAAARRGVESAEAQLESVLATATAPAPVPAATRSATRSGMPLTLSVLLLALGGAALLLRPARRLHPAPSPPRPPTPATPGSVWTCEISWAAGVRGGAGFHAVAAAPGRPPLLIARSRNLASLPFLPPLPEGETLAAARALVRGLLLAGWAPTTRERQWYSQRFEWTGDADPEPLSAGRDPGARSAL